MTENCKYFRHEPDYTPNNFDIYMDYTGIPSNIPKENANDLKNRLQKTMPLTKKIHLNLETETIQKNNVFDIHTLLKIDNKKVKLI